MVIFHSYVKLPEGIWLVVSMASWWSFGFLMSILRTASTREDPLEMILKVVMIELNERQKAFSF